MDKIAICGVNCITDIESKEYKTNQTIVIDGGIIQSIQPADSIVPNVKKTYCFDNLWAIPGFVDMHVHITMSPFLRDTDFLYKPNDILELTYQNLRELNNIGVTLCRDMGSYSYSAEWVKYILREQKNIPNILTCGKVLTYKDGHMHEYGYPILCNDDIQEAIEENYLSGANFIKIASDPYDCEAMGRNPNPAFSAEFIDLIVKCARKRNMTVACHTYPSVQGVARALQSGVKTIEHAVPLIDSMGHLSFPNTFFAPTFTTVVDVCGISSVKKKYMEFDDLYKQIQKLNKYRLYSDVVPESLKECLDILLDRVPIAISKEELICAGTDAGCKGTHFSSLLKELLFYKILGASNWQVLQYAISNPYKALGINNRGKLKEGNIADIIILENNPIDNLLTILRNVAVITRGTVEIK